MTMPERKSLIATMRAADQFTLEFTHVQRVQFIAQAVRDEHPKFAEKAEHFAWVFVAFDQLEHMA